MTASWSIGAMAAHSGHSIDTLRYYEKIGLLGRVPRDAGGRRRYGPPQLARLRFVQRAQHMQFSLREIAQLLEMREAPQAARPEVRRLTQAKLTEVDVTRRALDHLHGELTLLLNLCRQSDEGCPILQAIDEPPASD